jgi:phospholipase A1
MMRFLFILISLFSLCNADEQSQAELLFQNEEYAKAYELYLDTANSTESPEAAYKLGWMNENGKGVPMNPNAAIYWYKKAAKWDIGKSNQKHVLEALYRNVDPLSDDVSADTLVQVVSGSFGLRAYKPNYWIVSYTDALPKGDPALEATTYIHTETKFQISLRADLVTDWFGFTQIWTGVYTQTSYWQLFVESSPFRDTNYKPELFVTFPFYHALDAIHMKAISVGLKHASNGQPDTNTTERVREDGPFVGSQSRSWNRLFTEGTFQWENLVARLALWYRLPENYATNDNPDITDYYGHGSLSLEYIDRKLLTRLTVRQNFKTHMGSAELEMSYPLPYSDNVFFFLQGFTGYGQSLIDYDHYVNQVGFGLSISR